MECSKEGPLPDKLRAVNVWSQNVTDGLFSHVLRDKSDFGEWGGSIVKKKIKQILFSSFLRTLCPVIF